MIRENVEMTGGRDRDLPLLLVRDLALLSDADPDLLNQRAGVEVLRGRCELHPDTVSTSLLFHWICKYALLAITIK